MQIPSIHIYNTPSRTQQVHHLTKFNNQPTVFTAERTNEKAVHQQEDHNIHVEPETDTITVKPKVCHVHCDTTEKDLGYKDPIKKYASAWEK